MRDAPLWLHGSPYKGIDDDFSNYSARGGLAFFTKSPEVAAQYSTGVVVGTQRRPEGAIESPTVYTVTLAVAPERMVDFRISEHRDLYEGLRREALDAGEDPEWLPSLKSLMTSSRLPGYEGIWAIRQLFSPLGYKAAWVDEGSQGASLGVFDARGKVHVVRRNPDVELFKPRFRALGGSQFDVRMRVYDGRKLIGGLNAARWTADFGLSRCKEALAQLRQFGHDATHVWVVNQSLLESQEYAGMGLGKELYEQTIREIAKREKGAPFYFAADRCSAGTTSSSAARVWKSLGRDYPSVLIRVESEGFSALKQAVLFVGAS